MHLILYLMFYYTFTEPEAREVFWTWVSIIRVVPFWILGQIIKKWSGEKSFPEAEKINKNVQ